MAVIVTWELRRTREKPVILFMSIATDRGKSDGKSKTTTETSFSSSSKTESNQKHWTQLALALELC